MFASDFIHIWSLVLLLIGIVGFTLGVIVWWRCRHQTDRSKNKLPKLLITFSMLIIILSSVYNYIEYLKNPSALTKEEETGCAKNGEKFSFVYDQYPKHCCSGLKEWQSGMDTDIAIGDGCYSTGSESGSPVGTCITCGDNVCSSIENPCNCPSDCKNGKNADYSSVTDFCTTAKSLLKNACEDDGKREICNLCSNNY